MQRLELKATHKPAQNYYAALRQFDDLGVTHVTAVRSAFQGLLDHCARQHDWTLVPEWVQIMKERGKKVSALIPLNLDGFLFNANYRSGKKAEITSRVAANFVGWEKDHALFDRELERVIRALRTDEGGRERPPPVRL